MVRGTSAWLAAQRGKAMTSKKARKPTETEDRGGSQVPISGSYDDDDAVTQMKAIKRALDAYRSVADRDD